MFSTRRKILFFSCCLLIASVVNAQLVDLTRTPPYRPVFAATDAFDSSYLTQLEKAYAQNLPDTLKLSIGNDMAYYWHTRNLDKAYKLAQQVLEKAVSGNNKIWEGRSKGTGFGTELVNLLVQQLEGKLTADSTNGTTISIHFKNRKPH